MTLSRPTPARDDTNPLIKAMTDRFIADPKLVNEAVTGACCWPPEDDIEDMAAHAANLADDYRTLRAQGVFVPLFRIETLIAAENALVILAERKREDDKLARWAAEDQPRLRMPTWR